MKFDDLNIPLKTVDFEPAEARVLPERRLANLYTLWSNPAYWAGAIKSREVGHSMGATIVSDDHTGIVRLEAIQDALIAGVALTDIPEFQAWLAEGTKL